MEITVHSVIEELDDAGLPAGEPEINIVTLPVSRRVRGGAERLSYTEEQEGGRIDTAITVSPSGSVRIVRTGAVVWDASFSEGESCRTVYSVPPYSFDCTVTPRRVTLERDGEELTIRLVYSMELGGGKKDVKMRISVK